MAIEVYVALQSSDTGTNVTRTLVAVDRSKDLQYDLFGNIRL